LIVFGAEETPQNKIQNAHIGLTQPYSTCGYLAVTQMLNKVGTAIDADGNSFEYAGSHSNAALGVARGEYDIAGVKTAIARRYEHLNLKIIQTSTSFPGFSLIANTNTLSAQMIKKLRTIILSLDPAHSDADRQLMKKWGKGIKNGAVAPQQCDYQAVMETLEKMPWPIPGSGE
jgi:phosphonate transport system substrate-binding protein